MASVLKSMTHKAQRGTVGGWMNFSGLLGFKSKAGLPDIGWS